MTSPASRAGALAVTGALSVLAPVIGAGTAAVFGGIALLALAMPENSVLFDRLASRHDREVGQLRTIAGFELVVAALAILGTVDAFGLSAVVFAMAVVLVAFGHAAEMVVRSRDGGVFSATLGFLGGGIVAGLAGYGLLRALPFVSPSEPPALALFLVVLGALGAGLYRRELLREDPIEVVGVGLVMWFFAWIGVAVESMTVIVAVAVTLGLGVVAFRTGTVTVAGMLSGVLLALVTFVVGGFGWFVLLATFFLVGGLSTKFRYQEKAFRGVAESDGGRRSTANVMSNGSEPMLLVSGWATAGTIGLLEGRTPLGTGLKLAFAGAVGTALADTLSSEIGSLQDDPRLITSWEPVGVGTDGAVTPLGTVAGALGSILIAVMAFGLVAGVGAWGAVFVSLAGIGGMLADSIFGATLEGEVLGNDSVNLLATTVGAFLAGVCYFAADVFAI